MKHRTPPVPPAKEEPLSIEALQEKLRPTLPFLKKIWGRTYADLIDMPPHEISESMKARISAYDDALEICSATAFQTNAMDTYIQCSAVPQLLHDFAQNSSDKDQKDLVFKLSADLQTLYDKTGFVFDNEDTGGRHHWNQVLFSPRPPA